MLHYNWRRPSDGLINRLAEFLNIVSVRLIYTQEQRKKCKKNLVSQCHLFFFSAKIQKKEEIANGFFFFFTKGRFDP